MSRHLTVRPEDLSWRRVDDEVVVLDLRSSRYFSLNGSGALLWEALVDGADEEALAAALVAQFGIDPARAAQDTGAFLDDCVERGIVR